MMKQPPSVQPAPVPGPDYDPMDRIVQDLQNVESFLQHLSIKPKDVEYLNTHLSSILSLRRSISQQIDTLADEPYGYTAARLHKLHEENEKLFIFLEGVVGEIEARDEKKLKKAMKAAEETLSRLDGELTP
jgi:hypothetical protein